MLRLPKGSFADPEDALVLPLTFNSIAFKPFVLVATLAERIVDGSHVVRKAIDDLNPKQIADKIKKAKVCLVFMNCRPVLTLCSFLATVLLPHNGEQEPDGLVESSCRHYN